MKRKQTIAIEVEKEDGDRMEIGGMEKEKEKERENRCIAMEVEGKHTIEVSGGRSGCHSQTTIGMNGGKNGMRIG